MLERRPPDRGAQEARRQRRKLERRCPYDLSSTSTAMIQRIKSIDWFYNIGGEVEEADVRRAGSMAEARQFALCNAYVNVLIEASNDMTCFLFEQYPDRYQETWNEISHAALERLHETFDIAVGIGIKRLQIFETMREDLRETIEIPPLLAIHEIEYADVLDASLGQRLVTWYERGHWPCGFEGTWPDVRIVVY